MIMHIQKPTLFTLARLSLALLWIFTGLTSLFFDYTTGYQLLVSSGFSDSITQLLIYSGSILDISLGIWLLSNKSTKSCYSTQIIVITGYTLLLTIIEPSYWLHPFGPLTKNLPVIMLVLMLRSPAEQQPNEKAL